MPNYSGTLFHYSDVARAHSLPEHIFLQVDMVDLGQHRGGVKGVREECTEDRCFEVASRILDGEQVSCGVNEYLLTVLLGL